jgi:GTPase SAR1 family protein
VRLLVGTKLDLTSERIVTVETAEKFAQKNGMCYLEVSSRSGTNIEEAFRSLAEGIKTNREKEVNDEGLSIVLRALQDSGKKNC